jgi:hypothetical protein
MGFRDPTWGGRFLDRPATTPVAQPAGAARVNRVASLPSTAISGPHWDLITYPCLASPANSKIAASVSFPCLGHATLGIAGKRCNWVQAPDLGFSPAYAGERGHVSRPVMILRARGFCLAASADAGQ